MTMEKDQQPHGRPADGLGRYAELASDLTRTTLGVTERALAQFVRQGEVAAEHAERVVEEIIARSVEGSGALARLVRGEVERTIERAGFVTSEELEALRRQVDALRAELDARDVGQGGGAP
ncbi:MAG TPA: phasin family protein [Euzebyales bacterium]|nr:phasin family protein [Euzebyales bacterium]